MGIRTLRKRSVSVAEGLRREVLYEGNGNGSHTQEAPKQEATAAPKSADPVEEKDPDGIEWGPMGKAVFERTYSRLKGDQKTNETWPETIRRVVDGNLALVDAQFHEPSERDKLYKLILKMDMIPAGRHLWATGVPGRQYLSNCVNSHWSRNDLTLHFTFLFDELMKGGGVGSNYSNKFINIYPPVFDKMDLHIVCNPSHPNIKEFDKLLSGTYTYLERSRFVVEDSREGWCAALAEVLRAAWDGREGALVIDVSLLRARGELLKSFGGVSSGPAPLAIMLGKVAQILNSRVGKKLSSLDMMQIDHEVAACVVSGNIRRSARLSVKHWADEDILDFIKCKSDDPEAHWSANLSVEVDDAFFQAIRRDDKKAYRVLRMVSRGMWKNGEPGFWNSSLSATGEVLPLASPNPCAEIILSRFDICCLGHVNLERFAGRDAEAREAFRLMTRFLIRATFGDIIHPLQKETVDKNRRIGVGFFGFHPWLVYQGVRFSECHHRKDIRDKLHSFYKTCRGEADRYAHQLRIPAPIKVCAVAPTGSISNLPGTSPGCQPIFAQHFIRRVNFASNDRNLEKYTRFPIEDSKYTPNTKVVSFYCKDPLAAACQRGKGNVALVEEQRDISLSDNLAVEAMLQDEYADNAISYTINFNPDKVSIMEIERALRVHLPHLKGTTLMPEGDSRPQMPFQRITEEEYEEAQRKGIAMVSDADRGCANGVCTFDPKKIMR